MPRGRRPNIERRISDLIAQLQAALVAREQRRIEQKVAEQVAHLVKGLCAPAATVAPAAGAAKIKTAKKVPGWISPGRRRQIAAMKVYWAAKKLKARWAAKKKTKPGTNSTGPRRTGRAANQGE